MKTRYECLPCYVRQAMDRTLLYVQDDNERQAILREVFTTLSHMDFSLTPPEIAADIQRIIREHTGVDDPYREERFQQNAIALSLLPTIQQQITDAPDPWTAALKAAIAGNAIDMGVYLKIEREDIERDVIHALQHTVDEVAASRLRSEIDQAKSIVFIGDNAGEIVFDKLLIEQMPVGGVTYIVRGGPVLNDVTIADAEQVGLDKLVRVVNNGARYPGTVIHACSQECRELLENADVRIAKGQGNYETLSTYPKPVWFLFKAKCPVIAEDAGVELGSFAVKRSL